MFKKLFRTIFDRKSNAASEHCVIVYFNYGKGTLAALHELENKLRQALDESNASDYDGHDVAIDLSDGMLYMYGEHTEQIFRTVLPVLMSTDFIKGGKAKLRFGPPEDGVQAYFVDPIY